MEKREVTDTTLDFWNTAAERYGEGVLKELKKRNPDDRWISKILENAPKKERLRILDIGTGPGFFTIALSALGHDVIGIDITPNMVAVAKKNAAEMGIDCDFRLMNANTLEFPDDTFDLIVNRYVSWTLPDMFECYREWRRVLAPNGKIIVFDSNHYINLFDQEKAKVMRLRMREAVMGGEEFNDRFDFHVRWKYWEEDVPNIGAIRPKHDENMLLKLRYINIFSEEPVFSSEPYGDQGTGTPTFMICAEKPNPDQENDYIVNEYWNAIAGCTSGRAVNRMKDGSAATTAKALAEHIPAGAKVLDIGTGSAPIAIELSRLGYDVTGVDRAFAQIDMARITAEECGADIGLAVADAEDLPYGDGSFDAVVLRNVVWNSYRPQRVICEAARVLRKGGVMVIEDGNWQADIAEWEAAHEDKSEFPNWRKRDAGLGAFDVLEAYYAKLPLDRERRPDWDRGAVAKASLDIVSCEEYDDPMITDDLVPLKNAFILVARK